MIEPRTIKEHIDRLIKDHNLAVEKLTEVQLAEVIRQAIASGDLMRHVTTDGRQSVTYVPFREVERLKAENEELRKRLV